MAVTIGTEDLSSPAAWRATGAEFIATLLFIFIGAGTVVVTGGLIQEALTSHGWWRSRWRTG